MAPSTIPADEIKDLLQGAWDLHVHAGPDVVERAQDCHDLAADAARAGLAGLALKDHTTSTTGRAAVLNRLYPEGPRFLACLALNHPVGGFNPSAVESFLREGGRIVHMPTYAAQNHLEIWGAGKPPTAFPLPREYQGLTVRTPDGGLSPGLAEILELIAAHDAVLATGHLSPSESLDVMAQARQQGVRRLIFNHVSETVTRASLDQQRQAVALGAFIDHCCFTTTPACPGDVTVEEIADEIREIGLDHVILTSDLGQKANPPAVECFGQFIGRLALLLGDTNALARALRKNPCLD